MSLPIVLVPHPHVRVDPKVLGGSPHVVGSRVPVRRLWAFYRSGTPIETLIRRFPQLGPAKIFDALAFAFDNEEVIEADLEREQELLQKTKTLPLAKTPGAQQMALPFGAEASESSAPAARATRTRR
jgi:uncharacterized protein (DUF433 family)